jgi:cytochrome c oxidase cbb3-type subunit 3
LNWGEASMRVPIASLVLALNAFAASAQQDETSQIGQPMQPGASPRSETGVPAIEATPGGSAPFSASANPILHVPVSGLHPGNVSFAPKINNPLAQDPQATTRGMQDFNQFNCVGCHAGNGGGGMGPALSEGQFIYGSTPANLFLSIYQGRPNGMPAWAELLPESTIWELVAYVQSIAHPPSETFGRTISRTPPSPSVEQTPSEFLQTVNPWSFTTSFSNGQKPVGE